MGFRAQGGGLELGVQGGGVRWLPYRLPAIGGGKLPVSWLSSTEKVSRALGKAQSWGSVPVNWLLPAEKAASLPSCDSAGSVPFRALLACTAPKESTGATCSEEW